MSTENRLYNNVYRTAYSTADSANRFVTANDWNVSSQGGAELAGPSIESLVDKMWERMFEKPAIVACGYCQSHNAFTNPSCVTCGAPMGEAEPLGR